MFCQCSFSDGECKHLQVMKKITLRKNSDTYSGLGSGLGIVLGLGLGIVLGFGSTFFAENTLYNCQYGTFFFMI